MAGVTDLTKLPPEEMLRLANAHEARLCRKSFYYLVRAAWNPLLNEEFIDGWHIAAVCYHLQALWEGKLYGADGEVADTLVINLPSGCSKSVVSSVLFPAWIWAVDPTEKMWYESFEPKLSVRDASATREIIKSKWYKDRFWGDEISLTDDQAQKILYRNTLGGWRLSLSIGSGAGLGWHPGLLLCDDPHNPKQALDIEQAKLASTKWDTVFASRGILKGVKRVVIAQRLSEIDLSAHVKETDQSAVFLTIPMWYEKQHHCHTDLEYLDIDDLDENGNWSVKRGWDDPRTEERQLMWPEGMNEKRVEKLKAGLRNAHMISAQMQQRPTAPDGDFFQKDWFHYVDAPPKKGIAIRAWDKAASTGPKADFTAGVLVIYDGDYYYIVDVVRGKWERKERDGIILATAERDSALVGSYTVLFEQEPGSGGKDSAEISASQIKNAGFTVRIDRPTSKKQVRWEPLANEMALGRVKVCRGSWNKIFEAEMLSAGPDGVYGRHDDMIDAASMAVRKAAKGNGIGKINRPLLLLTPEEQTELAKLPEFAVPNVPEEDPALGVRW